MDTKIWSAYQKSFEDGDVVSASLNVFDNLGELDFETLDFDLFKPVLEVIGVLGVLKHQRDVASFFDSQTND